jgi:hypothetical protein
LCGIGTGKAWPPPLPSRRGKPNAGIRQSERPGAPSRAPTGSVCWIRAAGPGSVTIPVAVFWAAEVQYPLPRAEKNVSPCGTASSRRLRCLVGSGSKNPESGRESISSRRLSPRAFRFCLPSRRDPPSSARSVLGDARWVLFSGSPLLSRGAHFRIRTDRPAASSYARFRRVARFSGRLGGDVLIPIRDQTTIISA